MRVQREQPKAANAFTNNEEDFIICSTFDSDQEATSEESCCEEVNDQESRCKQAGIEEVGRQEDVGEKVNFPGRVSAATRMAW